MPICLKTDGQDFSMGKEHQGEMPHVRRRYFKLNLQQAETIEKNKLAFRRLWGKHWEGPQNSVLRKIVLFHWPLRFPKFTCCEMLVFVAGRGHRMMFHPLQKKSLFSWIQCETKYVITCAQCYKRGNFSAVFIGTEHVFTLLDVSVSHFKLLFLLDTLDCFSPNCTYPKPTRL